MQFPFETTTKGGWKATVLGTMPDGRLIGHMMRADGTFVARDWNADGSAGFAGASITLPLQIKPLTTYRMRNGEIAWTSGLVEDGLIYGLDAAGHRWCWRVENGCFAERGEHPFDLIEELPPVTTA